MGVQILRVKGSIVFTRGIRQGMVIVRFLLHQFCHSLQLSMTFTAFSLNIGVELFESIEPRLEVGDEMEFLVACTCVPGQGEIHPRFNSSMKFCVIEKGVHTME